MSEQKPNIVILDAHTCNPGDLDFEGVAGLGNLTVYDRTSAELVIERAKDADLVLTNKVVLNRGEIENLPNLKYIGILATGYNMVDLKAASDRGIVVTNVPDYSTVSVGQMVFAHILNLTQHVAEHSEVVKKGKWAKSIDFCYWDYPLMELGGLTLGIVGFGRIGKAVVNIAQAFGMKVLINSRNTIRKLPAGTRQVEVEELFSESDIVSLHCPLTDKTEKIVNAETLGLMKPCAFVINTGRGPLVDEGALADALNDGRIAGAGVDVLSTEPPAADNPLLSAKNCYITPHIAWATRSARKRLIHIVTQNCVAFLNGSPVNMVNI